MKPYRFKNASPGRVSVLDRETGIMIGTVRRLQVDWMWTAVTMRGACLSKTTTRGKAAEILHDRFKNGDHS